MKAQDFAFEILRYINPKYREMNFIGYIDVFNSSYQGITYECISVNINTKRGTDGKPTLDGFKHVILHTSEDYTETPEEFWNKHHTETVAF